MKGKPGIKKGMWSIFILAVLILSAVGCGKKLQEKNSRESGENAARAESSEAADVKYDESAIKHVSGPGLGKPFNGEIPFIYLNGKLYYWSTISLRIFISNITGTVNAAAGDSKTWLPEDFEEVGDLVVTDGIPEENCQIRGFQMTGKVYANPAATEVIYAWIESPELTWKGGKYVRFATEFMREEGGNGLICLNGRLYVFDGPEGFSWPEEELPEGYESAGMLTFIGQDYIPANNLETNCMGDIWGKYLDGREVYASSENPEKIYVHVVNPDNKSQPTYGAAYLLDRN